MQVHSEHFYAALKGRFQSLRDLRVQIQNNEDLQYANAWIRSCLILHNLIIDFEEQLGIAPSATGFAAEYPSEDEDEEGWEEDEVKDIEEDEQAQHRTPGQQCCHTLMQTLLHQL